jgi:hypothetical protein
LYLFSFLDLDFESSPGSGSITAFSIGGSLYSSLLDPLLDGIDKPSADLVFAYALEVFFSLHRCSIEP